MNLASHFKAATSTAPITADVETGVDSLEAVAMDVAEIGHEMTENTRVVAELQEVADSLESYREALTLTQESGEIDQTAASWMMAAGEAITARVGVSLNSVSVESFGSPSESADAVELISLEASDLWNKLVQAIKDMIAKARVSLKKLWVKLTDGGAKLAKRGEALAKKARDTKGSAEDKTFEASFVNKIHLDGKAPKGADVVANVKAMDTLAKAVFEKTESEVKTLTDDQRKLIEAAADGKDFDPSAFIDTMKLFPKALGLSDKGPDHLAQSDGDVTISTELLGGKVVYASVPADGAELSKAIQQFRMGVGNAQEKNDTESKGDVEVLSTSAVSDLGTAIKLIGDRLSGFNKKFEARDKMKDQLTKLLDKVEKKAAKDEKDMTAEQKQASRDGISAARAVVEALDNPVSDYARYLMTTLTTVVSWGEKSLSMYKES